MAGDRPLVFGFQTASSKAARWQSQTSGRLPCWPRAREEWRTPPTHEPLYSLASRDRSRSTDDNHSCVHSQAQATLRTPKAWRAFCNAELGSRDARWRALAGGVPVQDEEDALRPSVVHWFLKVAGEAFRPALAGMAFATRQNGARGKVQTVSWWRWQLRFRMLADDLCDVLWRQK